MRNHSGLSFSSMEQHCRVVVEQFVRSLVSCLLQPGCPTIVATTDTYLASSGPDFVVPSAKIDLPAVP